MNVVAYIIIGSLALLIVWLSVDTVIQIVKKRKAKKNIEEIKDDNTDK